MYSVQVVLIELRIGWLLRLLGAVLASSIITGEVSAASLGDYAPVTDERLRNPEPQNWLQWRGNYAGWTYSPLAQINSVNVQNLGVAWAYSTGVTGGHQAPPIVNNGYMFVATPENQVIALDARTGYEIWRYQRQMPKGHFAMHPTSRGAALYGDKVYVSGLDTCATALNARTGELVWENCLADWRQGFHMTIAPLAVKGKIIFGVSGAEFGIRCFLAALDAETGKELWRTYTIPAPGEPGSETWQGDTWRYGGGSVWITGTYDPDLNLAFYGIGNPAPWVPEARPGDNLYTNSVIAIDIETGAIKGFHQYHWNDGWDWDEVSPPVLIDVPDAHGKSRKRMIHAGRNGYLWFLEWGPHGIEFVDAKRYVKQDVFTAIDPVTGRPNYDPARIPGVGKTVQFCPSIWGGKDWPPESYNPITGLLYIPAHENLCSELTGVPAVRVEGEPYLGFEWEKVLLNLRFQDGALTGRDAHIGEIQAWDPKSHQRVWTYNIKEMNWGPILSTAGNLLFSGGSSDRAFRALDATTGHKLWEMRLDTGITGVPASYMIDGVQYVAVQAGWGVDAETMQAAFNAIRDDDLVVPRGGTIWVFALKQPRPKTSWQSIRSR